MPTPADNQAAQREEAATRRAEQEANIKAGNDQDIDRPDNRSAEDASDEETGGTLLNDGSNNDDEPQRTIVRKSPSDSLRDSIASRFRRPETVPFSGDINDDELVYGRDGRNDLDELEVDPDLPEPGVPAHLQQQQEPRKIKIKVNGKEMLLTEDEVIARAQKVEAADSYLDEAKTLLKEAREIKRTRSGADVDQHQDDDDASDTGETNDQTRVAQDPGQKLRDVVKKIQFDDPEEAAAALGEAIEEAADRGADKRQMNRLLTNDLAKSKASLKAFTDKHPELATDVIAAAAIEASMYQAYREDIIKLGVDEDTIPKNPVQLADWHRFYRVHGHEVRTTEQLLNDAKAKLDAFRGTPRRTENNPPPRAQPRVQVNMDRTERRERIPVQPSRVAVRQNNNQPSTPQTTDRSSIVAQIRKQRGQAV